ncbi:peroxisome proliferator-activated receptor gamma coactivator-related protein 1-like isoform X2 [Ornithodoros turicata]
MRPAGKDVLMPTNCRDVEQMCFDLLSGPLLEDDDKDLLDSLLGGDLLPLLDGENLEPSEPMCISRKLENDTSADEEVDVVSVDEVVTSSLPEKKHEPQRAGHVPRSRQKPVRHLPRAIPPVSERHQAQKPRRTSILIQTPGRGRVACPAATALDHDYCGGSESRTDLRVHKGMPRRDSSRSSSRSSSSSSSDDSMQRRPLPPRRQPTPKEERRVVYVGNIPEGTTRFDLRQRFGRFGAIEEVSVHFRDRGDNYGFVTFVSKSDAYEAVEHGNDDATQPRYDLCFGGRRQFCRSNWADLDSQNNYESTDQSRRHRGPVKRQRDGSDFDSLLRAAKSKSWGRRY